MRASQKLALARLTKTAVGPPVAAVLPCAFPTRLATGFGSSCPAPPQTGPALAKPRRVIGTKPPPAGRGRRSIRCLSLGASASSRKDCLAKCETAPRATHRCVLPGNHLERARPDRVLAAIHGQTQSAARRHQAATTAQAPPRKCSARVHACPLQQVLHGLASASHA